MLTDSLLRPFALLRLITSRPFFVDILTKKPWVRLREVLLGWNVLFIAVSLYSFFLTVNDPLNIPYRPCQYFYCVPYASDPQLICLEKHGRLWYSATP